MEDQDVSGHLTREKFEELAAGIFGRVTTPLQAVSPYSPLSSAPSCITSVAMPHAGRWCEQTERGENERHRV
jgi:hypothetical protein